MQCNLFLYELGYVIIYKRRICRKVLISLEDDKPPTSPGVNTKCTNTRACNLIRVIVCYNKGVHILAYPVDVTNHAYRVCTPITHGVPFLKMHYEKHNHYNRKQIPTNYYTTGTSTRTMPTLYRLTRLIVRLLVIHIT